MIHIHTNPDGTMVLPGKNVVMVDNVVDSFVINIRSSGGISAETVKNLLERKFEVTEIEHTQRNSIVI